MGIQKTIVENTGSLPLPRWARRLGQIAPHPTGDSHDTPFVVRLSKQERKRYSLSAVFRIIREFSRLAKMPVRKRYSAHFFRVFLQGSKDPHSKGRGFQVHYSGTQPFVLALLSPRMANERKREQDTRENLALMAN